MTSLTSVFRQQEFQKPGEMNTETNNIGFWNISIQSGVTGCGGDMMW